MTHHAQRMALAAAAAALALLLVVPLLSLLGASTPGELGAALGHPLVWPALRLSAVTSVLTLGVVLVCGTPLAWWLARAKRRWAPALEVALQLPMVIPPAVSGIALLLAFGRRGAVGGVLADMGLSLAFSTMAVVLAQLFVAAPIYVQGAVGAFRRVDRDLIDAARAMGASPWRLLTQVAVPLAAPGLAAGAALAWARALGEFGATLMFAGSLTGKTQTLPLAIYAALETDVRVAQALSLVLVGVALAVLLLVRAWSRRSEVAS